MEHLALASILSAFQFCTLRDMKCTPDRRAVYKAVVANQDFTGYLYKELSASSGNMVFSPLGVEAALAVLFLGAHGDAAKEIHDYLGLNDDPDVLLSLGALVSSAEHSEPVHFDLATRLYLDHTLEARDTFVEASADILRADVGEVGFSNSSECAYLCVNEWVRKRTHDHVINLLQEGSVDNETLAVVVNAAFFKGILGVVSEHDAMESPFHLSSGEVINVDMLCFKGDFDYGRLPQCDADVVVLPYQNGVHKLLIAVPCSHDHMKMLEKKLFSADLLTLLHGLERTNIYVHLPRFQIENTLSVKESLKQLSLEKVFSARHEFSGIAHDEITIEDIFHKAVFHMTDKGSATSSEADADAANSSQLNIVHADRPFIFLVLDKTGVVVMAGRVDSPVVVASVSTTEMVI